MSKTYESQAITIIQIKKVWDRKEAYGTREYDQRGNRTVRYRVIESVRYKVRRSNTRIIG